jgi:hypothetical protein
MIKGVLVNKDRHLITYSWHHVFTAVIWCDKCRHSFREGEVMYKYPKKVDGIRINYYYCMRCAKEFKLV